MFYVYEWFIVETGEVIYVGKGTGNRYKVRKHNQFFNDMIRRNNCDSRIVKEFESEADAFDYEYIHVKELKEAGQCVCNIYDGGRGGSTDWWTDDLRKRYSEKNVMKSEAQRKRMSESNPMKNKDIAEKTGAKKRIPVVIGDVEYKSIKEVCQHFGVASGTVNAWCVRGFTGDGQSCHYRGTEGIGTYHRENTGRKKSLIYKGVEYPGTAEAAEALGLKRGLISRWCRQGRDTYGNPCRYTDDTRDVTESPIRRKHIPVTVNGVWYPSKEEAGRQLGISAFTITQYLKGKKQDDKYICEYA